VRAGARAQDREIIRLAVPALGALAAEPLYILVDTAIVGHLGTPQLAALAIAGALLTSGLTLFNFLTYGTTAQVARYHGAGREVAAGRLAAQSLWLSVGLGAVLVVLTLALARPAVALMGGEGRAGEMAVTYLRISSLGLPFALIALAGQGYLRGVSSLQRPLAIVVLANLANVVLELLFVYGFEWGIAGSAWGTVIAQAGMGAAFVRELLAAPADDRRPRPELMRPLGRMSGNIAVRTGALIASFLVASAVIARIGQASLGAHQIAFQLFFFIALVLDAIAIAGQVIVGRLLGAADADGVYAAARRMNRLVGARRRGGRAAERVHRRSRGDRARRHHLAPVRADAADLWRRVRAGRDPDRRGRRALPQVVDGLLRALRIRADRARIARVRLGDGWSVVGAGRLDGRAAAHVRRALLARALARHRRHRGRAGGCLSWPYNEGVEFFDRLRRGDSSGGGGGGL